MDQKNKVKNELSPSFKLPSPLTKCLDAKSHPNNGDLVLLNGV